jgi:hypothetical protein
MQRTALIVAGVVLASLLILVTTTKDSEQEGLPNPELILLLCVEDDCKISLVDENLENPVELSSSEVMILAASFEEIWQDDHDAYAPLSIAGLYLFAGEELPGAYQRYESFMRDLIDSDIEDDDLYTVVYAMTWDHWQSTQSPHLLPALEMLYDLGRTRIRLSGFESEQRYRDPEEVSAPYDPFVCSDLPNQLMMVGILGDLLRMRDRQTWMMHGGDAALSCYMCEGVPGGAYDPRMAWMLYQSGEMEEDARLAATSMGNAALTAAVGQTSSELNSCQQQYVQELQGEGDPSTLVDEAVLWYAIADMSDHMIFSRLAQSADYADSVEQFDVASYIRSFIDQEDPKAEPWEATPLGDCRNSRNTIEL